MPSVPFVAPAIAHLKKPAWLNDPLNYHDRGNIDFGSCSQQCFEQGDFFGLDDLFTEKPTVVNGLAADLRDVDHALPRRRLPRRHGEARERRLLPAVGAEDPRRREVGRDRRLPDLRRGELNDAVELSDLRARPRPAAGARLPVPGGRGGVRVGRLGARGIADRLQDDDYFRSPTASTRRSRRSSATTTWAAPRSRSSAGAGARHRARCSSTSSSGTTSCISCAARPS